MKFMERIALDEFSFVNVKADNIEDLTIAAEAVRNHPAYKDRVHKPAMPQPQQYDAYKDGMGMKEVCTFCGALANKKTGTSKKTGKPWTGIFCSADKSHVRWL